MIHAGKQHYLSKEELEVADQNHDGQVDATELRSVIQGAVRSKQEVKLYRYGFMIFMGIWFVSLVAIFAVVYGAIEMAKDSRVKSNNEPVLVTPGDEKVIQTANTDFYVLKNLIGLKILKEG